MRGRNLRICNAIAVAAISLLLSAAPALSQVEQPDQLETSEQIEQVETELPTDAERSELESVEEAQSALSSEEPPPFKSSDFDLGDRIAEMVFYLVVLCGRAALAIFLLKRRMVAGGSLPQKMGSKIQLLDRKVLSTRTTLHLIEADGHLVMVSESNAGQTMLELATGTEDACSE